MGRGALLTGAVPLQLWEIHMSTPQHPGFSNPSQQSGMSLIRMGLVIFIATFLAIVASCYAITKYAKYENQKDVEAENRRRGL
jgi:hypothetical protein